MTCGSGGYVQAWDCLKWVPHSIFTLCCSGNGLGDELIPSRKAVLRKIKFAAAGRCRGRKLDFHWRNSVSVTGVLCLGTAAGFRPALVSGI